jgi:HSP20 family molecular chaperone IbpA
MLFDFDRDFYRFTRNLKDMYPYEIIRRDNDNEVIVVHNVVGLSKDDIKISVDRDNEYDYLVIAGERKNEVTDKIYKVDSRFIINLDDIDSNGVEYKVEDGLLYIYIKFKTPEKPNINIKYRQ